MSDHRISIEINLTGRGGEEQKIDWWLNWTADMPSRVFNGMIELAEKAGLDVDPFYEEDAE